LAVRAEAYGDTRLAFQVDGEGRVRESEIIKSSGLSAEHKLLDATALASFKRCRFSADSSMGSSHKWVEIEYSWQLK
jgi:TonB family protein